MEHCCATVDTPLTRRDWELQSYGAGRDSKAEMNPPKSRWTKQPREVEFRLFIIYSVYKLDLPQVVLGWFTKRCLQLQPSVPQQSVPHPDGCCRGISCSALLAAERTCGCAAVQQGDLTRYKTAAISGARDGQKWRCADWYGCGAGLNIQMLSLVITADDSSHVARHPPNEQLIIQAEGSNVRQMF